MAYKPLKKRYMTQEFDGPLSKMINKAVEERVSSVLKNITEDEDEMEMSDWEKVSSKTSDLDMSNDPRYSGGTTTTDVYSRQGEDDPFEGKKVDSDTWKSQYEEAMQGGGSDGMKEYVKKYNMDGTAKTEYKEETTTDLTPAELEKIQRREVGEIEPVKPTEDRDIQTASFEPGESSFAAQLGLNLDDYSQKRGSSNFAQKMSKDSFVDNPFTQYLQGYIRGGTGGGGELEDRKLAGKKVVGDVIGDRFSERTNKKLNKAFTEYQKGRGRRLKKDFNQWLLEEDGARDIFLKDKEFKKLLDENPNTKTNSLYSAMFDDSYSRENFDQGFDPKSKYSTEGTKHIANPEKYDSYGKLKPRYQKGGRDAGEQERPPTDFNTSSHMSSRKTMSFRKPQPNTGGFKMKRHAK